MSTAEPLNRKSLKLFGARLWDGARGTATATAIVICGITLPLVGKLMESHWGWGVPVAAFTGSVFSWA
ncbi:MAG TPA: hypothetical protein VEK57_18475 [Thermoanaerobaculia bacterium]|nr:hypothetical protein [Thermoanaerobaculia bacterium]